jgi:hypothetical protein
MEKHLTGNGSGEMFGMSRTIADIQVGTHAAECYGTWAEMPSALPPSR